MRNRLIKTFNKEAIQQNKSELTGGYQLVHAIRMILEADPEAVCV